jgi:hypothetical protein
MLLYIQVRGGRGVLLSELELWGIYESTTKNVTATLMTSTTKQQQQQ